MNKKYIPGIAVICLAAVLVACGGGGGAKTSTSPAISVSITPVAATIPVSGHQQFSAGASAVTWSVDNVSGGNGTVGTITSAGLYSAPTSKGSHTVAAVNPVDASMTAMAMVTVAASGTASTSTSGVPSPVSSPTSPPVPANSTTYANIDQMSGWSNCGACAGSGGNGPNSPHSLTQNVSSPSMDGKSAHFWIGGKTPFADALWWKELGANGNASHFIYDLFFYYNNASAAQALEFDGNQSVGGRKYIFGHQCNVAAGQWDVWNTAGRAWVHTGVSCAAPPTQTWNHVILEYERVNGQTHFIAITFNGKKSYINRFYGSTAAGGNELNVAFQMDEVSHATNYDVWLDKVNLTAW